MGLKSSEQRSRNSTALVRRVDIHEINFGHRFVAHDQVGEAHHAAVGLGHQRECVLYGRSDGDIVEPSAPGFELLSRVYPGRYAAD